MELGIENLKTRDAMTNDDFDTMIRQGLEQARQDQSEPIATVFDQLRQ